MESLNNIPGLPKSKTLEKAGTQARTQACASLASALASFAFPSSQTSADNQAHMRPQRPLDQAVPASLGQNLRDLAFGFGRGKNLLGGNIAYGLMQSLKECLYFLLCCWCIKEILD